MKTSTVFLLLLLCSGYFSFAQTANLKGIVLNEQQKPVAGVSIQYSTHSLQKGTTTNTNGFYSLHIPADTKIWVHISHLAYKSIQFSIKLTAGSQKELHFVLQRKVAQISQVVITNQQKAVGIVTLSPESIRKIPGANAGVENLLKTLPGVSSNNELSTQYAVRGGNYDENLVYVNGIEIYRPFLIRSGQQEGLSFINPQMVRSVHFSAGGFQAKYGDKLSSVLDIKYRRPIDFGAALDLSFLGGSIAVEGVSKNKKLSAIVGLRYRDNSLFVNAKETETNYHPIFADVQSFITYAVNDKFEIDFLGNISINKYQYQPLNRQTNFGTLQDPHTLVVFYEGQEKDKYATYFGALKASYALNENYTGEFIFSAYNTQEQEYYDILAEYRLGKPNTDLGSHDLGEVEFTEGIGAQLTHARNDLDALIFNFEHKGTYHFQNNELKYGLKYTRENIQDRIREYEIIDSAGFSIRPLSGDFTNEQPYESFSAPLAPFRTIRAKNETTIQRISGYAQWSSRMQLGETKAWLNLGARFQHWRISGSEITTGQQTVFSPRAQFAIKPNWKQDMLFKISGGFYHQPPFYAELRGETGTVHPQVKAQQAVHLVLRNEYSFQIWKRPFKLISEAYYKNITHVNPYTLENVRIRYKAHNNAKAYAYGFDFRMNGEFVPGTQSWVSVGYLQTKVNINKRGYIPRPTDQRLKFALLFQDYMPSIPSLKMHLNLVYNTGLPGGTPNYADPYEYQFRLPDYQRVDVGLSYVFVDAKKTYPKGHWLHAFKELSLGFEIFNLFDRLNSITNTFVRDVYTKTQYAVPNYLSPRVFNLRLQLRF